MLNFFYMAELPVTSFSLSHSLGKNDLTFWLNETYASNHGMVGYTAWQATKLTFPLAKPRSLRHCITIFSVLPDANVRVMLYNVQYCSFKLSTESQQQHTE